MKTLLALISVTSFEKSFPSFYQRSFYLILRFVEVLWRFVINHWSLPAVQCVLRCFVSDDCVVDALCSFAFLFRFRSPRVLVHCSELTGLAC